MQTTTKSQAGHAADKHLVIRAAGLNPFEDWAGAAEFFLALRKGCPEPIPDR